MMISENIRTGIASVRKARFRSFFTMLGIIIGVVSVVTIVSLGEGVKRQVAGQASEIGTNLVTIKPGKTISRDATGKITSVNILASTGIASLTKADVNSVKTIPGVVSAVSMSSLSGLPSYNGKDYPDGVVIAASEELSKVFDHEVEFGTYPSDVNKSPKSVLIGAGVAEKMFNETVPVGKSLSFRGQTFVVQGIFSPFSDVGASGGVNMNNVVIIPQEIASSTFGNEIPIYQILIKADSPESMVTVAKQAESLLKQNHSGQEDFTVLTQDEVGAASSELLDLLTKMIVGMAAITIFVGGVGIMNVMLVSVSERNREIGIRKSIGATNSQIRSQFLIESIILSVWGTLIGVALSVLLNIGLRLFTDMQPVLLWQPILIASSISIAVGVLFGVFPAIKASKKDPIDSLRLY